MTHCARLTAFVFLSLFPIAVSADQRADVKKLQDDLRDAEVAAEKLKAFLPPTDPAATKEFIGKIAVKAELKLDSLEAGTPERVNLANGHAAPVEVLHLDVKGIDDFADVLWFLRMTDLGARPMLIESLHLAAEPDGKARYEIRFAAGSFSPVERPVSDPRDIVGELRHELEDERQFVALLTRIVGTKNASKISAVLAAFTKNAEKEAITVSDIRFSDRLTIEGVAAGAAARSAVRDSISMGPVVNAKLGMDGDGVCREFTIEADLRDGDVDEDLSPGPAVFDPMSVTQCAGVNSATRAKLNIRGSSTDAIRLKLRDVDAADVFLALHDATGEGFVLDSDVDARLDANIESATLDETLAAMKGAGFAVGPGPLHRVARNGTAAASPRDDFSGERISVAFRHADVRDVLCLFSQISGLQIDVPPEAAKKITIFAKEIEWDRAVAGVIAAAGMQYTISGTRVLVAPAGGEVKADQLTDACKSSLLVRPDRFASLRLEQLGASDLKVAGVAHLKDGWQAYIVSPGGRVLRAGVGQKLFDATATSIDANGVTLETNDSREVRLTLEE